jgi:uncharacterized protein YjbI with pentapeptide repeats
MRKNELISRWYTEEGTALLNSIFFAFSKKKTLNEIVELKKHDGRWDLRGAPLSGILNEINIGNKAHQLSLKSGSLEIKNYAFNDVDFSYATISYGQFYKCTFQNCEFTASKGKEMHIYACNFDHCSFEKADFSYSFINKNISKDAGSFTNCKFQKTNLRESIFTFPIMESCLFEDCGLYACSFDGSRMRNVKFIGIVDSPWFNGYSTKADTSVFWVFNRINPKEFPNPMYNVDFSEAELLYIVFGNGIDLSKCIFPKDDARYLYIKNLKEVSIKAIELINKEWEGRDKEIALGLMNAIYFSKNKQDQKSDFVSLEPGKNNEIDIRLFMLFNQLDKLYP